MERLLLSVAGNSEQKCKLFLHTWHHSTDNHYSLSWTEVMVTSNPSVQPLSPFVGKPNSILNEFAKHFYKQSKNTAKSFELTRTGNYKKAYLHIHQSKQTLFAETQTMRQLNLLQGCQDFVVANGHNENNFFVVSAVNIQFVLKSQLKTSEFIQFNIFTCRLWVYLIEE